jgi:nucleoid DNA-binding protein
MEAANNEALKLISKAIQELEKVELKIFVTFECSEKLTEVIILLKQAVDKLAL